MWLPLFQISKPNPRRFPAGPACFDLWFKNGGGERWENNEIVQYCALNVQAFFSIPFLLQD
jgi:hypothetical protein